MEVDGADCFQLRSGTVWCVSTVCVFVCSLLFLKKTNSCVGVQAKVSELEEEMMQLQPYIVDVQRQPWRSGETLDT